MSKEAILVSYIRDLVAVMEMQEGRENGSLHISQEVASQLWNKAKEEAKEVLEEYEGQA